MSPTSPHSRSPRPGRHVTAVLGPTNTGKTHLAVERMLGHETGMIGLPLRLLAREVYDRVVARISPVNVALITGEEKIVPAEPRYIVCTVEAMPAEMGVDFLAIDEVQLAADPERGHVFTDRLLNRRGRLETMLLGADTARGLIEQLLPDANFIGRPRFSKLTYAGEKKVSRLPRRTAIVTFSADAVYAIAELIRRQRGGAAVVMGALSPRTRNAQVALYQSGDVDFLVATDAIGMGLNMDVDHIAFAARRKFDGLRHRALIPAELAQIAGRAGRHMNDGTFGVTGDTPAFDADVIERIEGHSFEPLRQFQWRNSTLDFASIDALRDSLNRTPSVRGLARARPSADFQALELLMREPEIRDMAATRDTVERLWTCCQIPDYRNLTGPEHARLVDRLFRHLMGGDGFVPADWLARQLSYCDRTDGDIDTLANRIAHIRSWTFVANRSDWTADPEKWRERTRSIEDRLSDALHERLTQRFIDRRTSVLMRGLREKDRLMASISKDGEILVEGEYVGRLDGFHFIPDQTADGIHGKALRAASLKAISNEIAARADTFATLKDEALTLERDGTVSWVGPEGAARVGRLKAGEDPLRPRIEVVADEQLEGPNRARVQKRLEDWMESRIATDLEALVALSKADDIDGIGRGLAFRLVENFGTLAREEAGEEIAGLDQAHRAQLRKYGVRFGAFHLYLPALLKPAPARLLLILWGLREEAAGRMALADLPEPPQQGLTSVAFDRTTPRGFYGTIGFKPCGPRAVRIDMLERLADLIRPLVFWKPARDGGGERPDGSVPGGGFTVVPDMMSLVGCSGEEFASILKSLGFRTERRKIAAPKPEPAATPTKTEDGDQAAAPDAPEAGASEPGARPEAPAPEAAGGAGGDAKAPEKPTHIDVWWPKTARRGGGRRPARKGAAGRPGADGGKAPADAEAKVDGDSDGKDRKPGGRPPRAFEKRGKPGQPGDRPQAKPGDRPQAKPGGRPKGKKGGKPGRDHRRGGPRDADRAAFTPKPPPSRPEDSPFAALQKLKDRLENDAG